MAGYGSRTTNPGPNNPNAAFKTVLTGINAKTLEIRLNAAETNGDAKVISRPKVTTLNNKAATIQSGITFFVKTLSNVLTTDIPAQRSGVGAVGGAGGVGGVGGVGGAGGLGTVAGGVTSLQAGLNLDILPILVGDDEIKLNVDINNSTSDLGSSVDGIPGILKNSANTTVIVRDKQTAVIAGLIKQNKAKTSGGVPFLQDIPLLGLLFKSHEVIDQNNELVIFLTPTIGNPENTKTDSYVGGESESELEAASREPANSIPHPEMAPQGQIRR
jgi:type II secretory pathway component GspD/PulD (secretin)